MSCVYHQRQQRSTCWFISVDQLDNIEGNAAGVCISFSLCSSLTLTLTLQCSSRIPHIAAKAIKRSRRGEEERLVRGLVGYQRWEVIRVYALPLPHTACVLSPSVAQRYHQPHAISQGSFTRFLSLLTSLLYLVDCIPPLTSHTHPFINACLVKA